GLSKNKVVTVEPHLQKFQELRVQGVINEGRKLESMIQTEDVKRRLMKCRSIHNLKDTNPNDRSQNRPQR
ncbi:Hypothetical predicted protein, partial [Olea europaea subsp. europaea]